MSEEYLASALDAAEEEIGKLYEVIDILVEALGPAGGDIREAAFREAGLEA